MARADLHYALVLDREIYDASRVDPTLLDPVIRPAGPLPGPARPFTVVREYQGPQGGYTEQFVLSDPDGRELYRSQVRVVQLSGEMFNDRFATTVRALQLHDYGEHQATFYIDDAEAGSIPVFIEAARGGHPKVALEETLSKALTKGEILWLEVPQPPAPRQSWRDRKKPVRSAHHQAVWFVYEGGKVYVLNGPQEQQVPGLPSAERVTIIARSKDHRSEVARVPAQVRLVDPSEEVWDRVVKTALTKRLNLPDLQQAADRWRETCALIELTPALREIAADDRAAAPTAAAPAEAAAPAAAQKPAEDDIKVEAEIDQATYDKLIAEGKSERMARAKAKAAYVRQAKERIRAEREAS